MSKSLFLGLSIALGFWAPPSFAQTASRPAVISSGRSVSRDMREAWFRQGVGNILEGRAATGKRKPSH